MKLTVAVSRTLCIYFALLEALILVFLKDLETKLCSLPKGGVKKRFCLCRNLTREFILSITFKATDSPERLPS